jgi:hypothetical protein
MHKIYFNGKFFAEYEDEAIIGAAYQMLLNRVISFGDNGKQSVELRKYKENNKDYESVVMTRQNEEVIIDGVAPEKKPLAKDRETKPLPVPEKKNEEAVHWGEEAVPCDEEKEV